MNYSELLDNVRNYTEVTSDVLSKMRKGDMLLQLL